MPSFPQIASRAGGTTKEAPLTGIGPAQGASALAATLALELSLQNPRASRGAELAQSLGELSEIAICPGREPAGAAVAVPQPRSRGSGPPRSAARTGACATLAKTRAPVAIPTG